MSIRDRAPLDRWTITDRAFLVMGSWKGIIGGEASYRALGVRSQKPPIKEKTPCNLRGPLVPFSLASTMSPG